jgi:sigma-E factor negative regulatory protein RseA
MNEAIKMQISAFVDGELPQNEAELLLRRLCQDRSLRQQATEYLAMGRVMRGERVFTGMASLRERITAELDDTVFDETISTAAPKTPGYLRPLAGVAIAAAVALVALLGLQQFSVGPALDQQGSPTAAEVLDDSYTVPDSQDDPILDYARRHNASVRFFDTQLVTYPVPDEQAAGSLVVPEEDGSDDSSDASDDAVR